MSASLVGSEMCIRDSSCTPSLDLWPCLHARPATTSERARESGNERGPVSYTHLTLPTICSV
eukprot:15047911-Alexandrium_andersonii.AAC.1